MADVGDSAHTPHGLGKITEVLKERGGTSFRVAGKGFSVWVSQRDLRVANDSALFSYGPLNHLREQAAEEPQLAMGVSGFGHAAGLETTIEQGNTWDNSTTLPYSWKPQHPVDLFRNDQNIKPGEYETDADDVLHPSDSVSGASRSEPSGPQPNPDLFLPRSDNPFADQRVSGFDQHWHTNGDDDEYHDPHVEGHDEFNPYGHHHGGQHSRESEDFDWNGAHHVEMGPEEYASYVSEDPGASGGKHETYDQPKVGWDDPDDSAQGYHPGEPIRVPSATERGGRVADITGWEPGEYPPEKPKHDHPDTPEWDRYHENVKKRPLPLGSYRPAGLSDRYASFDLVALDNDSPAAKFRNDPLGFLRTCGYIWAAGDDHLEPRFAEYTAALDADPSIREAAWSDVRTKAMRLRHEGKVHVNDHGAGRIYATVEGDNGTYDTMIVKGGSYGGMGGGQSVTDWTCSCDWGRWAFKRQMTYVGRLCSHGYATYLEMQSKDIGPEHFNKAASVDGYKSYLNDYDQAPEPASVASYLNTTAEDDEDDREAVQKLYDHVEKNPDESPERKYDIPYVTDPEKAYKESGWTGPYGDENSTQEDYNAADHEVNEHFRKQRAEEEIRNHKQGDLLRSRPDSLTPDLHPVPEGEDEKWMDVTKDERETTGPDQIVHFSSRDTMRQLHGDATWGLPEGNGKLNMPQSAETSYTVKPGDNLSDIAKNNGLGDDWKQLVNNNPGDIGSSGTNLQSNPDLIHPGDQIKLPGAPKAPAAPKPAAGWDGAPSKPSGWGLDTTPEKAEQVSKAQPAAPAGPAAPDFPSFDKGLGGVMFPDQSYNGGGGAPDLSKGLGNTMFPEHTSARSISSASDSALLDKLRDMSTNPVNDNGSMDKHNDELRKVTEELNDRGYDASFMVAMLRQAKDEDDLPSAGDPSFMGPSSPGWADQGFAGSGPDPKYWHSDSAGYVDEFERPDFGDVTDFDGDDIIKFNDSRSKPQQGPRSSARQADNFSGGSNAAPNFATNPLTQEVPPDPASLGAGIPDSPDGGSSLTARLHQADDTGYFNPDNPDVKDPEGEFADDITQSVTNPVGDLGGANEETPAGGAPKGGFSLEAFDRGSFVAPVSELRKAGRAGSGPKAQVRVDPGTRQGNRPREAAVAPPEDFGFNGVPDLPDYGTTQQGGADIIANFHRNGAQSVMSNKPAPDDFSGSPFVQSMLRTAGRTYTPEEQRQLEAEFHPQGARNLPTDDDLAGTHYLLGL